MEKCIFEYFALHIECRFHKNITPPDLLFQRFCRLERIIFVEILCGQCMVFITFYFNCISLFLVPFFVIWSFVNTIAWSYQSTQALPFTTVLLLMLIWIFGNFDFSFFIRQQFNCYLDFCRVLRCFRIVLQSLVSRCIALR